jgi:hypothetical protein
LLNAIAAAVVYNKHQRQRWNLFRPQRQATVMAEALEGAFHWARSDIANANAKTQTLTF